MSKILFKQPLVSPTAGQIPTLPAPDKQFAAQNRVSAGAINATWPDWRTYFRAQGADLASSEYLTKPDASDACVLTGTSTVKLIDTAGKYPGDELTFMVELIGVQFLHDFDKTTIPIIDRPANYATLAPLYTASGANYATTRIFEPLRVRLTLVGTSLVWVVQSGGGSSVDFENIDNDVHITQNSGLYLSQVAGVETVGDERLILGAHQKYVAGAGWVDISVASNGSLTTYLGEWDAALNSPEIVSGVGSAGDWYLVGVAGSTVVDDLTPWGAGDVIWYSSSAGAWQMISNQGAAPTKPVGATGAPQLRGSDGNFGWTTDFLWDAWTQAVDAVRFRIRQMPLFTTPRSGLFEYTGTSLYFTLSDLVRRAIPVKLTSGKMFFGGASNEITEIAAIDVYGASTSIKTFLDTEANWIDGSGNPKSSVFPGGGEVGQKHRNTNYIFECVSVAEWVRYILPAGYIDLYGVPSASKILIENTANWTDRVYTGTALTGCLQGMKHFDNDYFFEFVSNNTPIRTARV